MFSDADGDCIASVVSLVARVSELHRVSDSHCGPDNHYGQAGCQHAAAAVCQGITSSSAEMLTMPSVRT